MKVEIKIDDTCEEPRVVIVTDRMTEELNALVALLSEPRIDTLAGFRDNVLELLPCGEIVRIYAQNQRVYAKTAEGEYTLKQRLYELGERLDPKVFARISNSEIINLKMVSSMDLGFSGTICVRFKTGETSYVSRRYVARIKQILGI